MPDAGVAGPCAGPRRTHGAAECGPVYFRFNSTIPGNVPHERDQENPQ